MAKSKVLIVDDEQDVTELLEFNLRSAGYDVISADDGATALKKAREALPDLIVLDVMLPEMDGTEVCKQLRRDPATARIPIIMLTAKASEIDRVLGLELGADDYICKPFSPREVVARVATVLRRTRRQPRSPTRSAGLVLDAAAWRASLDGVPLDLTAVEFKLLEVLSTQPGRIFSRDQLMDAMYRDERIVADRTVDSHVKKLRRKLAEVVAGEEFIHSIYGVGYQYEDRR